MCLELRKPWLIAIFLCGIVACNDDPNEQSEPLSKPEVEQTQVESRQQAVNAYDTLTDAERDLATRQPWEEPGMEHLRPPQRLLDSQRADQIPHQVSQEAIQIQTQFEQAWQEERARLTAQDVSLQDIRAQRAVFKAEFFAANVGHD